MTRHRYPWRAMTADYARGAGGLVLTGGPLWLAQPAAPVAWALGGAMALFLVYFCRTVVRHLTHIELDETGIRAGGPLGAEIRWDELRSIRLDYFSTVREDRSGGWMQLQLRGPRAAIVVDSGLEGFAEIARAAAGAARRRELAFGEATGANLAALGVRSERHA